MAFTLTKSKKPWTVSRVIFQIIMILLLIIWTYPLYKLIERSVYGAGLGNYTRVLLQSDTFTVAKGYLYDIPDFWVYLQNSLLVTVLDVTFCLTFVSIAAYAFSKMNFPLKHVLYLLTLVGMMMPSVGFIVPYFIILKNMGLINMAVGLVGPHVAGSIPMSMLLIKNAMDGINNEMCEAAIIDGCSRRGIFFKICLPLAAPAIGTSAIFVFNGSWNDYLLPLVLLNKPEARTLTLLPTMFTAFGGGTNYGIIFASLVLISVPIFVIYLFCQRYMISGLTLGSIK
jgi:ABC-type glycerol-3-phosphate transport system permease component